MTLRDAMRFDPDRAALYLERGWWSPADTLSRWLVRAASETPDAPAIVGAGRNLSYGALAQRVAALAGGLKALGLGSGDVVAVQLPNRAEYLVSYLAICAIGGVMTTLYMPCRAAEMESLLAHSGARAFIGLDEIGDFRAAQTVLDLRRRIAMLEHVLVLGEAPDGARPFADLTGAAAHDLSDPVLGERACCCITVAGGEAPTLEAICAYLDENGVAKVRWPERLDIVDAMPLTATRKIIKGRLTERLLGERS